MKILVLGANGMIGSAMIRTLTQNSDFDVIGTIRNLNAKSYFPSVISNKLIKIEDITNTDLLIRLVATLNPNVVINCIGLTKHHTESNDPLRSIPVNTFLPHRLAELCLINKTRLIHISTDCVFSGLRGNYTEEDESDAKDVYGKSKYLGEPIDNHSLVLRTSTIGHELQSKYGLLEWFLSQKDHCKGYKNAIFSGLPNIHLANIVKDIVLPRHNLCGLYHVGASSINKFDLLHLISKIYGKKISIIPDDNFSIDRSFQSNKFKAATGYVAPDWEELITNMYENHYH